MNAQDIPEKWWEYHHRHCGTIYRGCHPTQCPKNVYELTGKWIGEEKMQEKLTIHDIFLKQLVKNHPVREENRKDFKGKTIFGKEYEEGDCILWFMLQTIGEIPSEPIYTKPTVTFNMCSVAKVELDQLDEEYVLVRMGTDLLPIFTLKIEEE